MRGPAAKSRRRGEAIKPQGAAVVPAQTWRSEVLLLAGVAAAHAALAAAITARVPEPYMDEEFHIPQMQAICSGDFDSYHPKLTTPPGLYYAALPVIRAVDGLRSLFPAVHPTDPCSVGTLRQVNALFTTAVWAAAWWACRAVWKPHNNTASVLRAALIGSIPFLTGVAGLFYTDASALALALLTHGAAVRGSVSSLAVGAGAGLAGFFVRQTNLIWAAFSFGTVAAPLLQQLLQRQEQEAGMRRRAGSRLGLLVLFAAGCAGSALAYLAVKTGGNSVALGDTRAHAPSPHPAQLVYALALAGGLYVALPAVTAAIAGSQPLAHFTKRRGLALILAAAVVVAAAAAAVALRGGRVDHLYLLSDNRHVTFYAWRRLIRHFDDVRVAVAAGGVAGPLGVAALASMVSGSGALVALGWAACLCAALLFAPLLEPRYFIPPLAMFLIHAHIPGLPDAMEDGAKEWRAWLRRGAPVGAILAAHLSLSGAQLGLFLARPFQQPDGSVGRLMW